MISAVVAVFFADITHASTQILALPTMVVDLKYFMEGKIPEGNGNNTHAKLKKNRKHSGPVMSMIIHKSR